MSSRLLTTLGLILILIGGLTYLSFRPTTLLLFHTLDLLGIMPLVEAWRSLATVWRPCEFVIYSLPGGLWASAYILIVFSLLQQYSAYLRIGIASVIPLLGIGSELLQQWQLLPGTFDMTDLVCYATPLTLYIIYEVIKNLTIWEIGQTASIVSN